MNIFFIRYTFSLIYKVKYYFIILVYSFSI